MDYSTCSAVLTSMPQRSATLLAGVAFALCGCIASVKYPADWATIQSSQCADLSGSYENRGTVHRPTQMWSGPFEVEDTWLAPLFFRGEGRTLSDTRRPVSVQLDAGTPGRLGITATMSDGQAVPIFLHEDKKQFRCHEGKIEVSSSDFGLVFVVVGAGSSTYRLSKAADGALIVDGHDQMVGTALIWIPLYMSARTYARFGPATAPVAPATPAEGMK